MHPVSHQPFSTELKRAEFEVKEEPEDRQDPALRPLEATRVPHPRWEVTSGLQGPKIRLLSREGGYHATQEPCAYTLGELNCSSTLKTGETINTDGEIPMETVSRFMSGNSACVEGAIAAGCRFFAGYPITPANEINERMAKRMPQVGGIFIQMEDEIASICAIIGSSWTGVKAMTATSGPGFSLMQEGIGFAVMTETPCVIVDVQRIGPSTGSIFGQQGDVMQARWGTHGNCHEVIVLAPSSVQEMFHLTIEAFNLSEEYRVPVILLADACVGHLWENVAIPEPGQIGLVNRRKLVVQPGEAVTFEAPEDGAPAMAIFGEGYRVYRTAHLRTIEGYPVLSLPKYPTAEKTHKRLSSKIRLNIDKIVRYEKRFIDDARVIVISYGMSSRAVLKAVLEARKVGIKAGYIRLITVWPFHDRMINELCASADKIIVAEVNNGQILYEVQRSVGKPEKIVPALRLVDTHSPDEIFAKIKEVA